MPVPGGTTREVLEGLLAPLQEAIALAVAGVLQVDVLLERLGGTELVDDDRVVDDEIDGDKRVDLLGIAAEGLHGVTHGGEIDDGGNAGEVLHQHAGGAEGDLLAGLALVLDPGGDRLDVGLGDGAAVLGTQQVLEQHPHGEGQGRNAGEAVLLGLLQAVIDVGLGADLERLAGLEAVERHVAMIPSFWRPTSRPGRRTSKTTREDAAADRRRYRGIPISPPYG
jgi:hypothetical protein